MNRQGEMRILHARETIRNIFDISGFIDDMTIE